MNEDRNFIILENISAACFYNPVANFLNIWFL